MAVTREGIKTIKLPPHSPNLNAHCERFGNSHKTECLDKLIFFSEKQLWHATTQYIKHYNHERSSQSLDNNLIDPKEKNQQKGRIRCRKRLGGMLKYYYREAA